MLGIKINKYFEDIAIGLSGKIVGASLNDLNIKSIKQLTIQFEGQPTISIDTPIDITVMNSYLGQLNTPVFAYCLVGDYLYLYLSIVYSLGRVLIVGQRTGIPVRGEDSVIDVPENYIDLFTRYVIKEAAKIQGKPVPQSVESDIQYFESQLKGI